MKQIAKSLVLLGAMVAASSASASWIDDLCPYIGVDYKQTWLKGKGFFHDKVARSYPGATIYLGTKFSECFGAEIGYTWTGRKHKTAAIGQHNFFNRNIPGFVPFGSNNETIRTSTRFNSFHFDLNGYYPLADCFELIGSVGIASMKPKVSATVTHSRNHPRFGNFHRNDGRFLESTHGKSKGVWRLGAGAQYLFTECVGLRGMIRWESTSRLRIGNNDHGHGHHGNFNNTHGNFGHNHGFAFDRKVFKDAWSLALGLFVKF